MPGKPVLLAKYNPRSEDPTSALFPYPENSEGWCIWALLNEELGVQKKDFLLAFERKNLLDLKLWNEYFAGIMAPEVWAEIKGKPIIMLGEIVTKTFRKFAWEDTTPLPAPLLWQTHEGTPWFWIPAIDTKDPWYDNPMHRLAFALRLSKLYLETDYAQKQSKT